MNPRDLLKQIDTIDPQPAARRFWTFLWPFLEQSGAPLSLHLDSNGFTIIVGYEHHPAATVRMIETSDTIQCARYSNMPGLLAMIGTPIELNDQEKAARIYRRTVDYLLAA